MHVGHLGSKCSGRGDAGVDARRESGIKQTSSVRRIEKEKFLSFSWLTALPIVMFPISPDEHVLMVSNLPNPI